MEPSKVTLPICRVPGQALLRLEECLEELQEVVEEWIMLSIAQHDPLPIIDGIELQATVDAA